MESQTPTAFRASKWSLQSDNAGNADVLSVNVNDERGDTVIIAGGGTAECIDPWTWIGQRWRRGLPRPRCVP